MALLFEWDDRKSTENLRQHGVSFEEAATTFADPMSLTIDDPARRIGVFRRLSRVVRGPGRRRYHEERHWRFDIRLEELDPPGALFVSRGWGVPQQALMEADLYFAGVQQWLDQVGKAGHSSETQDLQPQTQDRILQPDNH